MANDWKGEVISIQVAEKAGSTMVALNEARVVMGRGLEGDRYFNQVGTYSDRPDPGREVTLVEFEAIEALQRDFQIKLESKDTRRNIVTKGVPLNHLVGGVFKVGNVSLRGIRLCEPCSYLESLTKQGVEKGLLHRGGLRAQILSDGTIRVGDRVKPDLPD
jgi:MOSC domain-containing protein YiiM